MGLRKDLGETGSLGKTDKVMGGRRRAGQEDKDQEGKPQVRTDGHSTGEGVRARRVHD